MVKTLAMRLAFRAEGGFWNAYHAEPSTMDGATLIGSIRMSVVATDPLLRKQFFELMQASMSRAITDVTGETPQWLEPTDAPEREKAGHG